MSLHEPRENDENDEEEERLLEDLDGHNLKPDPLMARTPEELEQMLRVYRQWSGSPSFRRIARRSNGAFSHGTVGKLLNGKEPKPPLTLVYLRGCIKGCGGGKAEQTRWVTAWRQVHLPMAGGDEQPQASDGNPND
jgi:hypothetical protein